MEQHRESGYQVVEVSPDATWCPSLLFSPPIQVMNRRREGLVAALGSRGAGIEVIAHDHQRVHLRHHWPYRITVIRRPGTLRDRTGQDGGGGGRQNQRREVAG
jgi:hypothetical protein